MANGLDVSLYQGKPDWSVVKSTGKIDFVYAKATDGISKKDQQFQYNWLGLKEAEILRGSYHFFQPGQDPIKQAESHFSVVGELEWDDLPPMADIEIAGPKGMSGAEYAKVSRAYIEKVEELFHRKVVVYTGGPIFNASTKGAAEEDLEFIADRELWLAAYVLNPDKYVPEAWSKRGKTWSIWQKSGDFDYTGKKGTGYRIEGINAIVDFNVTQGVATDMYEFIGATKLDVETLNDEPCA